MGTSRGHLIRGPRAGRRRTDGWFWIWVKTLTSLGLRMGNVNTSLWWFSALRQSRGLFLRNAQTIAISVRRPNEHRVMRVSLDFLTQSKNRLIDRSRRHRWVRVPPHLCEKLFPVNDVATVLGKITEELHLVMRQVDGFPSRGDALRLEVDHEAADRQTVERHVIAAQHGANPCNQLFEVGRLCDVVVCAKIQPSDLVVFLS